MLISIVMPAYNAEQSLPAAIESVLTQTISCWELIIVDDCSQDSTLEIANHYAAMDSRIRVLNNLKNMGASKTRHSAVQAALGEWLAFLDSDDAWAEDKLEKQVKLQKQRNARLVFTGSAFMDSDGCPIDWYLHAPEKIYYKQLLKQNLVSNSSVLVEKNTYVEYEVIGDNIHEDFACWLNMMRSGVVAYGLDEPLLIYRLSSNSKSGNKIKAAKMNWNTYRVSGLNVFQASYYMFWYVINGLKKYKHLK